MRERLCSYLVVLLMLFSGNISGQAKNNPVLPGFSLRTPLFVPSDSTHVTGISPAYYTSHLGFFCRQELLMDKLTRIQVRIRVGSVDYTNFLEQKPHTRFQVH